MDITIAIPARYGSTRFPGKPLAEIAGQTMLSRVVDAARKGAETLNALVHINIDIIVATDDKRIAAHCEEISVPAIMTDESCKTGSDRTLAALRQLDQWPEFVLNLQGDAPFTPPHVIAQLIQSFAENPDLEVITPIHRLSWDALDALRDAKGTTPFSGTTVTTDANGRALWFSKNIIPSIRKEDRSGELSPVLQHIGLYGFRTDILEKFCALPTGHYEALEGLEQLRLLENGFAIQTITVEGDHLQSGIDTPEDLSRAEAILRQQSAA